MPLPDLAGFSYRFEPAADPTAPAPTVLLLHGTGGNENDLLPIGRGIAPGAALLSPRGRVLEHGQSRFFRRLAEGVFDLEDLLRQTNALADFLAAAAALHAFDPRNVIALGFSNGANIASSLLLQRPGLLRATALLRGMVPFEPETPADLRGVPVLLVNGRRDPLIPIANAERLASILGDSGAVVSARWHPGGHGFVQEDIDELNVWMAPLLRPPS